ncbi:MAG TPA: hypothetical protein VEY30_00860, partial [Myxococcaceae bacterium]|nr:hypothetical protein [Myxococcaceae bacterium]
MKRATARHRRRVRVTLGGSPVFTTDVSAAGVCTELVRVLAPGSPVAGTITVGTRDFAFAGKVMWSKP